MNNKTTANIALAKEGLTEVNLTLVILMFFCANVGLLFSTYRIHTYK